MLAFGIGWLILEWQCRRLDRKRQTESEQQKADAGAPGQSVDQR
ncbi:MAG: hypothetical protein ABL907_08755 [Hyphomicrobium sp.]